MCFVAGSPRNETNYSTKRHRKVAAIFLMLFFSSSFRLNGMKVHAE